MAEVVHALVLLAHFHSLASFVFGSGINDEPRYHLDNESARPEEPILALLPPPHSSKSQPKTVKLQEQKGMCIQFDQTFFICCGETQQLIIFIRIQGRKPSCHLSNGTRSWS